MLANIKFHSFLIAHASLMIFQSLAVRNWCSCESCFFCNERMSRLVLLCAFLAVSLPGIRAQGKSQLIRDPTFALSCELFP